jgi:rhomboid protease GluP
MSQCVRCGREVEDTGQSQALCPQCSAQLLTPATHSSTSTFSTTPATILPPGPAPAPPQLSLAQRLLRSPSVIIITINVLIFVAMALQGRHIVNFDAALVERWGANSGALTCGGQWWRLLASTFVHAGIIHIAANMWCLFNLGWLAELLFGRWRFTLLYLLCGIGGSLASIGWREGALSVGASGAIFGIAGALLPSLAFSHNSNSRLRRALRPQLASIALFVVFNLAFGATIPGIDNAAHIGGLCTGIFLGACFPSGMPQVERFGRRRVILATIALCVLFGFAARYAVQRNLAWVEMDRAEDARDRGDLTSAIAHARRAVALHPELVQWQFLLGTALLDAHQYQDSLVPLISTTRLSPNWGPGWVNLCVAQREMKQLPAALDSCTQGARLSPSDPESWFNLSRIRYEQDDLPGAIEAMQRAAQLAPNGFDENLQAGLLLITDHQPGKALPYLQKAHDLHPSDADVTRWLAMAGRPAVPAPTPSPAR